MLFVWRIFAGRLFSNQIPGTCAALKVNVQDLHEDDPAQIDIDFQGTGCPNQAKLYSIRYFAIWTALVAAPFLKLSATTHILRVLG